MRPPGRCLYVMFRVFNAQQKSHFCEVSQFPIQMPLYMNDKKSMFMFVSRQAIHIKNVQFLKNQKKVIHV